MTKYSLFHKQSETDNIPFLLSKLQIIKKGIERVEFLGVLLDECMSSKYHIN